MEKTCVPLWRLTSNGSQGGNACMMTQGSVSHVEGTLGICTTGETSLRRVFHLIGASDEIKHHSVQALAAHARVYLQQSTQLNAPTLMPSHQSP